MECGHTCGIDRHKRQADRTLLFEYTCVISPVTRDCVGCHHAKCNNDAKCNKVITFCVYPVQLNDLRFNYILRFYYIFRCTG